VVLRQNFGHGLASGSVPVIRAATSDSIAAAVTRLRRGELVAMPTETVYGLGGAALDPGAVERIFAMKGRPTDNPLIVHARSVEDARTLTTGWDARAERLAQRFWPGPLTLVLPAVATIPNAVTAGRLTVALRVPGHPVALALLEAFGSPIAAPSANRSGRISPTSASHVAEEFPESDLLILDGGACEIGIESTVLELTVSPGDDRTGGSGQLPRILRPGLVSAESIERLIGRVLTVTTAGQEASPGTRAQHYAPQAPTRLISSSEVMRLLNEPDTPVRRVVIRIAPSRSSGGTHPPPLGDAWREDAGQGDEAVSAPRSLVFLEMPDQPSAYAARIYAALREADRLDPKEILIERVPEDPPSADRGLWLAIHDRLRRAAARLE